MENCISFFVATLILVFIPGPAVLFIVSRSVELGTKAGVVSVLGIGLGGVLHVLFATLGLSAVLATSALALSVVKYAGAAYLIYLGISKLLEKNSGETVLSPSATRWSYGKLFWQGFIVQTLNPKVALFFLSFLPQFIDPQSGNATIQMLGLGLAFVTIALLSDGAYAFVGGQVGRRILSVRRISHVGKWASGLTYLSLGLITAFSSSSKSK